MSLFFWRCLCLPCSHAPIKRHRGANNCPAMLQTAPQAQYTRRVLGADQEAKSRLITSFSSVFTNSPTWPLPPTVSIDHIHTSRHNVKALFLWGVFGMPARILLPDGAPPACAGGQRGDDESQRSEWHSWCFKMFNSKAMSSGNRKL